MIKIVFKDLPDESTPVIAETLNNMQNNMEQVGVQVGTTKPATNEKVWFKKGKNLFNGTFAMGYYSDTGVYNTSTASITSINFITVNSSTSYVGSFNTTDSSYLNNIICFDKNKQFLRRITGIRDVSNKFTTASDVYYIKLQFTNTTAITTSSISNVQLEQGTASTSYEAYIEPTIYTKNSNNVYEEFINQKPNDNYSSVEQAIGTWINGKTLYRKVYSGLTQASNLLDVSSLNIDELTKLDSRVYSSQYNQYKCGNFYEGTSDYFTLKYSKTNRRIDCNSPVTYTNVMVILEYTKTTD